MDHARIISLGRESGIRAAKLDTAFWGSEVASHPRTVDSYVDAALADLSIRLPGFLGFDPDACREAIALHVLAARSIEWAKSSMITTRGGES